MHALTLYYRPSCPFCQKVIDFISANGLEVPLRDIANDPHALETLIETGGKRQVPCLFINNKALYESEDIISWLKENGLG